MRDLRAPALLEGLGRGRARASVTATAARSRSARRIAARSSRARRSAWRPVGSVDPRRLGRGDVERRQLGLARGHLALGRLTLGREALQQRGLPGSFARAVVRRARGRALGILGHAAGAARFLDRDAGALQPACCLVRRGERHRRALGGLLERVALGAPARLHVVERGAPLERRRARWRPHHAEVVEDDAVTGDQAPAGWEKLAQSQGGGKVRDPRAPRQETGAVPIGVPAQAGLERTAPLRGDGLDEPIRLAIAAPATAARRRPG